MPSATHLLFLNFRSVILTLTVFFPCLLQAQSPSATTHAATNVSDLSATLNGMMNPGGVSNWVYFQFGTTTSYGQAIQSVPSSVTGYANVTESVVVSYLLPNTTYHFRMATDPAGMQSRYGADMTFTTGPPATPPITGTVFTKNIYATGALVECRVNSGSSQATVSVQYGTTPSYGSTATLQNPTVPISSYSDTSTGISGLQPGTTYHYRFKAVNTEGTTYSEDATFTTLEAPVITTGAATSVTDLSAVLNGTVDGKGGDYTIYVQYGPTTAYGQSRQGNNIASFTTGTQPCSANPTNLLPNTTYHYRLFVTVSTTLTCYGQDATFTTAAAGTPPEVQPYGASGIAQTPTRAELFLTWLKTGSSATTVSYEYGLTASYGSTAVNPTPKPVNTFQELYVAAVQLTGLTPDTTYHFRAKAANTEGVVYTEDQTFTTRVAPNLINAGATGVTDLAATLNGTVNTQVLLLDISFEYGTSTAYGLSASASSSLRNAGAAPVSVNLLYLLPDTLYHYRIKAVNHDIPAEVFYGEDATFITTPAATMPVVESISTSDLLTRSAQLQCSSVYSGSSPATVVFQYGTSIAYGSSVTYDTTLPMNYSQPVNVSLGGLTPGTTYHARVVATNAQGSTTGDDITFTTPAIMPPSIGAVSIQQARTTAALVQAVNVSAGSADAAIVWDYGLTTGYGSSVAASPATMTMNNTMGTVTGLLSGLQPGTTYHFRCRATSTDGSGTSADGTFTTFSGPTLPVTGSAASVGDLTAILTGSASTTTGPLTFFFELGTTTAYGTIFSPGYASITSATSTPVESLATGLLPNTTYHYRLSVRDAENNVSSGADMTFTTAAPATPPVIANIQVQSKSANGATLYAYVGSGSSPATVVFQYGTTTAYGSQFTFSTPVDTSQYGDFTKKVPGLDPSTTYHFRVVATNNEGTTTGTDNTFTTPALPEVVTGGATSILATTATLGGSVSMHGGNYAMAFDYGTTTAYGQTAIPSGISFGGLGGLIIIGIGGGDSPLNITASASVLPQTAYHFRLKLTDPYGNSFFGTDATFTTPAAVEVWRQQHFGVTANTGDAADSASPAHDGIPNLMKYALWMNPADRGLQPPVTVQNHNNIPYLSLTFSRNPNAIDLTYEVQAADSPAGPWTTVMTIPPGGSATGPGFLDENILSITTTTFPFGNPIVTIISDTVYARNIVSLNEAPRRFMRLSITRP